ncbi:hypothetical protein NL108_003844 [Boleophthalmus pectinirostris]|uniref:uncharacterized protein LOC110161100 n=1 Tax=Boleophthalmus pectinirostris TaxID=150288 RepID=UPI00242E9A0A|nr:uncharacterized protein LOC110161100 [Boleophthalmus pectinirostris]KAJ0063539.1 hypothetical protein NL108_003844 [Boleophthalmus pectinirostris]
MSTENPDTLDEVKTNTEMNKLLHQLETVASRDLFQCADKLVNSCYEKRPIEEEEVKTLLTALVTEMHKLKQDKLSWFSFCCPQHKVKVKTVIAAETYGAHEKILKLVNAREHLTDYEWVLLFCPVISRIQTDVEAALAAIPEKAKEKKIVLVLMFHTTDVDYSTKTRLNFQNVALTVKVLYHKSTNGYFKCDKNNQAIEQLKTFFMSDTNAQTKKMHSVPTAMSEIV